MSTNQDIKGHLEIIRDSINSAITSVIRYQNFNEEMTTAAKNTLLATVTTVPAALQHASNCATCNGWDGSAAT